MLSSISAQRDLWEQLAAMRAAQPAALPTTAAAPAATALTAPAAGAAGSSTTGTSPILSDDLMAQFLSFGGVDTEAVSASQPGIGVPGDTAAATAATTGTTASGGLGNLFADLTSLISHLSDASAAASGGDTATTTAEGTTSASATTGGTTSTDGSTAIDGTGLDSASALSAALVQDLQSIASDVSGAGSIFANGNTDSASNGTMVGMPPGPPFGGMPSWDPSTSSVAATAAGTTGTAATTGTVATTGAASAQNPSDALLQQIGQAVAAYMQSIAGQSSGLGASLPNLNV